MFEKKRYYYLSYAFNGGSGNCFTISDKVGINPLKVKDDLENVDNLQGVTILNIMEMSKTQYDMCSEYADIKKDKK